MLRVPIDHSLAVVEKAEGDPQALQRATVTTSAWCWAPDLSPREIETLIALRVLGAVPVDRLLIACPDDGAVERTVSAAFSALAARGLDAGDLPDTVIALDRHEAGERGERIADASMVVARAGQGDAIEARRLGRPVFSLG